MTKREITDRYLAYRHMKRTKGENGDTLLLMPFFIMDAAYQIYCKDIKDLECKHLAKQAKKKWAKNYHSFTTEFFLAFDEDQTEFITDMMDEFNDYIHNHIVLLKSTVMTNFTDNTPFEDKKVLSSLLACNVLAQAAQHLYGESYRKSDLSKQKNKYIEGCQRASYEYACQYPVAVGVDLTSSDKVMKMIDGLCKKIIQFLSSCK